MPSHFRRFRCLAAMSLCLPLVAGCHSQDDTPKPSPYTGTWRGAFADRMSGQQGTVNLTIDAQGHVTGRITGAADQLGTVTGEINNGGAITLGYTLGAQTFQGGAMAQLAPNGHLVTWEPSAPNGGPPLLSEGVTTLTCDLAHP